MTTTIANPAEPTIRGMELWAESQNKRARAYDAFLGSFDLQPFLDSCQWLMSLSYEDVAALAAAERAADMAWIGRAKA
jgi:hypothetical protein